MKLLSNLTSILVIIGCLNWLAVALGLNVVEALLGAWGGLVTTVYWLIGLSALFQIYETFCKCSKQSAKGV